MKAKTQVKTMNGLAVAIDKILANRMGATTTYHLGRIEIAYPLEDGGLLSIAVDEGRESVSATYHDYESDSWYHRVFCWHNSKTLAQQIVQVCELREVSGDWPATPALQM